MMDEQMREPQYAGSNWLEPIVKEMRGVEMSDFGRRVADLLGELYRGIYHIQPSVLHKRADWSSERYLEVVVYGGMATFDADELTRFVVLCHDYCIRGEVSPASPGWMRLRFWPRKVRDGGRIYERHPTMEQAVEHVRRTSGLSELAGKDEEQ
jgi:hypothetical protein